MKCPVDRFDIESIHNLLDAQKYDECLKLTKQVIESVGAPTGWLHWAMGVCEDMTGNPFGGLYHFRKAIESDPYNYAYLNSISTNLNFFRQCLVDLSRDAGNLEEVERIHKALVESGEFTSVLQYLVTKNYVLRNEFFKAHEILTVYLMNNPQDEEAINLEKIVSRNIGLRHTS